MLITHRHTAFQLAPPWLRRLNAFRLIYACALILDVLADALMLAVKVRFLNYLTEIGLERTARERRIVRGPNESVESFVARLANWWETGKRAGHFAIMLEQLAAYFLPEQIPLHIVRNDGVVFRRNVDGTFDIDAELLSDWDWDGHTEYVSRFWLLVPWWAVSLTPHTRNVGQPGKKVRQAGMSVGSTTPILNPAVSGVSDAVALRNILEAWRPPHTRCEGIIVYYSAGISDLDYPTAGDWADWGNRSANNLYWRGTE